MIAEFERRFDAKLNIELYDSNEALLAKLQSGGASYDIIVPSDYMVTVLREHAWPGSRPGTHLHRRRTENAR